jgi:hypothetical protein
MLACVGKVCVQSWQAKTDRVRTTASAMTSRTEMVGERHRGTVMGALTLRDGPIWWHYQSVSGIVDNMLAGRDKPHLDGGLGASVAGRNQSN